MPTPQTNTTLTEIAELLMELDDFVICGHVNPDGDCLGSQLALYHALVKQEKKVTCVLAKNDKVDANLMFMPGMRKIIPASEFTGTCKTFIAVDVPTKERLGDAAVIQEQAETTITIDHHAVDSVMSEYSYTDADSPSASMLIWKVCRIMGMAIPRSAQCALTGLITDTGRFAFQNTNSEAFRLAAEMMDSGADPVTISREFFQNRSLPSLQLERILLDRMQFACEGKFVFSHLTKADFDECNAVKADSEALIDTLRSIRGVRVALILRENAPDEIRGSMRAKDDDTDVAQVARSFDGGGHKAAAGFTFHGSMEEALIEVPKTVNEMCFCGGAC
jgi:bifunctional oligoribonuclease and PAP phosphatase NrnA